MNKKVLTLSLVSIIEIIIVWLLFKSLGINDTALHFYVGMKVGYAHCFYRIQRGGIK